MMAGVAGPSGIQVKDQLATTSTAGQGACFPLMDKDVANKGHLWWLFDKVPAEIFFTVLIWFSPGWDQHTPYGDYLSDRGISIRKPTKTQISQLQSKSPKTDWDISFMHFLIKLSWSKTDKDHEDSKWSAKIGTDPQCSLTALKDARNDLAHTREIGNEKSVDIVVKVRMLTERIRDGLKSVRQEIIPTIPESEIDNKFRDFLNKIDEIVNRNPSEELFSLKKNVIIEHLPQLETHLRKFTGFSPVSQLDDRFSNCQVNVQDVFTEMTIKEGSDNQVVELENLLKHLPHDDPEGLLLIKGLAGIGKSTLVRKLISDWLNKAGDIKGLESFDLLFHVECRHHIDSFKSLLVTSLGDAHKSFNENEFIAATLAFKCLIIVDGYDELNNKSYNLVKDLLALKKSHKMSLIFTSRPEAEVKFRKQVRPDFKRVTEIRLKGIPMESVQDFVRRYHTCVSSQSPQPIDGLLKYIEDTKHKMSYAWKSPYNLSILVILWSFGQDINAITTEVELHMNIFSLEKAKLEERLARDDYTKHLPESILSEKLEKFLWYLSKQALTGLKNNEIILSQATYKELTKASTDLGLPAEQVLGAFIKEVTAASEKHYSFAHKGVQDFFGAYHILLQVTKHCNSMGRESQATDTSSTPTLAQVLCGCLPHLKLPNQEANRNVSLRGIFKELHPGRGSVPEKYQNLLCNIISVSQLTDMTVPKGFIIEALSLLQETGLKDKDSWIRILTNMKCDPTIAQWIAKKTGLLKGTITIRDFSFDAYLSILEAIKGHLWRKDKICINFKLAEVSSKTGAMARAINAHGLKIKLLRFREIYRGFTNIQDSQVNNLHLMLQNCEEYEGLWSSEFNINPAMQRLSVRIPNEAAWNSFFDSLETAQRFTFLNICFGADISPTIRKIQKSHGRCEIAVTDVKTKEQAKKVCDLIQGFDREVNGLYFPRCLLNFDGIEEILDLLPEICDKSDKEISDFYRGLCNCSPIAPFYPNINFPKNLRPVDDNKVKELEKKARESAFDIWWKEDSGMWPTGFDYTSEVCVGAIACCALGICYLPSYCLWRCMRSEPSQ